MPRKSPDDNAEAPAAATSVADGTVAEAARRMMGSATAAERKIVRVLLAAYPTAGLETVAELAARAGVSSPSVVRFVCKLGFSGYPAFQEALRHEIAERFASPLRDSFPAEGLVRRGEDEQDLVAAAAALLQARVRNSLQALPRSEFAAVTALLADRKRRLFCFGGRYSRVLAMALQMDLNYLRPNTHAIGQGTAALAEALLDMGRSDILVVFDYRRYQKNSVRAARLAAARGATVVLVTDPWLSPIAEVADHVLTVSFDGPSPLGSMVSALALVETLVAAVAEALGGVPRERLERFDDLQAGFVFGDEPAVTEGLHGGKGGRKRKG